MTGNHEQMVRSWRRQMALRKTLRNRPDLLDAASLSAEGRRLLETESDMSTATEELGRPASTSVP